MKAQSKESVLYSQASAQALSHSERTEPWRLETDQKKLELILQYANGAKSLLDIGCGWGQILRGLVGKIPVLVGVDESRDRLSYLKENPWGIRVTRSSIFDLNLGEVFEIVLTSHLMHELRMFSPRPEFIRALEVLRRHLAPDGHYFMIDHEDPGQGKVTVRLKKREMRILQQFGQKFRCRPIQLEVEGDCVTLSKRDCHDFVTKIWAMGTGAQDLEMQETHTVMRKDELLEDLEASGLHVSQWIPFNPIEGLMKYYSIEFIDGRSWERQFMLMARKI